MYCFIWNLLTQKVTQFSIIAGNLSAVGFGLYDVRTVSSNIFTNIFSARHYFVQAENQHFRKFRIFSKRDNIFCQYWGVMLFSLKHKKKIVKLGWRKIFYRSFSSISLQKFLRRKNLIIFEIVSQKQAFQKTHSQ